jgi:hypothetical protein
MRLGASDAWSFKPLIGGQQAEGNMLMQYWKPIGLFLGVSAGALMVAALSASPAYAWTDDDPATVSQCTDPGVNDAGTLVGTCEVNNAKQAFVRALSARSSTFLAPLAATSGGAPCAATGINNAAAGSETIVGWCADANSVAQGVFWHSGTPTTAPTLLEPDSILGLLPDVETEATAYNTAGVIVGISISDTGTFTPVEWSSAGVPTPLSPALLSQNANCVPADINDAATPSIIGNCSDAGTGGGNKAVLWASASSAYTVLPLPSSANYCMAGAINLSGQIMGDCTYADDTHRVVLWGPGGAGPTVLATVGGGAALRTYESDLNDSGIVACNYLAGSASAGFKEPCYWNPAGGNTNAVAITPPAGATGPAITTGIGNNGKIIGDYETSAGVIHPLHAESGSSVAVDDGSPESGPNMIATSISKTGAYEAGAGEDTTEHTHDVVQTTP